METMAGMAAMAGIVPNGIPAAFLHHMSMAMRGVPAGVLQGGSSGRGSRGRGTGRAARGTGSGGTIQTDRGSSASGRTIRPATTFRPAEVLVGRDSRRRLDRGARETRPTAAAATSRTAVDSEDDIPALISDSSSVDEEDDEVDEDEESDDDVPALVDDVSSSSEDDFPSLHSARTTAATTPTRTSGSTPPAPVPAPTPVPVPAPASAAPARAPTVRIPSAPITSASVRVDDVPANKRKAADINRSGTYQPGTAPSARPAPAPANAPFQPGVANLHTFGPSAPSAAPSRRGDDESSGERRTGGECKTS